MLDFLRRENRSDQNRRETSSSQADRTLASRLRLSFPQEQPEGYETTPLEKPWFPGTAEATALHDRSLEDFGQPYAPLLDEGKLDGAMARAGNYWYYGDGSEGEKVANAAGALAHGMGMSQAYEDGNKRTAYHTTRYFLDKNGYAHLSPPDEDDDELAEHLEGHGEGTHDLENTQALFRSRLNPEERSQQRIANILDPIHDTLDPRMFDNPASPEPVLKPEHSKFIHQKIFQTLEDHGYDGMEKWLSLVLTGSLTTYQYSDMSDCDISLWVDSEYFPEWSRGEMIGIMVQYCDGTVVPGTPFPLQDFVVSPKFQKEDLYKPGLRSGYDLSTDTWIVPPDKSRVHDVEAEMNLAYTQGLEAADKMDRLLRFEPLQAIRYWHTIHKKRQRDMSHGLGDYATSNIIYKMLANRGYFTRLEVLTGEHIAAVREPLYPEPQRPNPEWTIESGGDQNGPEYHGYYLMNHGQKPIGKLDYTYHNGDNGIRMVEVLPEYRGQGVADSLLNHMKWDQGPRWGEPELPVYSQGGFNTPEGQAWLDKRAIGQWNGAEPVNDFR